MTYCNDEEEEKLLQKKILKKRASFEKFEDITFHIKNIKDAIKRKEEESIIHKKSENSFTADISLSFQHICNDIDDLYRDFLKTRKKDR